MRPPAVIQADAARRARAEKALRERIADGDEQADLTAAHLDRIERLIRRYAPRSAS
jgi:hypothetical protein